MAKDKEKAPTRKEMDELYEMLKDETPSGFSLPVGKEGDKKIMKALRKIRGMAKGGMAGSRNRDADMRQRNEMRQIREMMMGESGASLSDRDRSLINQLIGTDDFIPSRKDVGVRGRQMIMDILGGAGRPMSDADRQLVNDIMRARNMEEGGEAVPAKFKGFSKLPEKVQKKMDPNLAQKYKKGGAVGSCRGMGAALRGGKFSGVK